MYLAIIGLACFLTVGILLFIREFPRAQTYIYLSLLGRCSAPDNERLAPVGFFRNGMRKYMLPVTIGACCMAVGFGVRIVQVHNSSSLGVYIGQTLVGSVHKS